MLLSSLLQELGYDINRSARLDFTAWRMRAFYRVYREAKWALKQSPLARFLTCMDRFEPGFLNRDAAYWVGLQGSDLHGQRNQELH